MPLSTPLHRPTLTIPTPLRHTPQTQTRHATLIRRPQRPYTFTQLVTLSDGSTFLHRTTSPKSVYLSAKDTRNAPLWNPSSARLQNMEVDEAGKLRAFREKFGRGWDAERMDLEGGEAGEGGEESLMDLISGFGEGGGGDGGGKGNEKAKGKGKGGER